MPSLLSTQLISALDGPSTASDRPPVYTEKTMGSQNQLITHMGHRIVHKRLSVNAKEIANEKLKQNIGLPYCLNSLPQSYQLRFGLSSL